MITLITVITIITMITMNNDNDDNDNDNDDDSDDDDDDDVMQTIHGQSARWPSTDCERDDSRGKQKPQQQQATANSFLLHPRSSNLHVGQSLVNV